MILVHAWQGTSRFDVATPASCVPLPTLPRPAVFPRGVATPAGAAHGALDVRRSRPPPPAAPGSGRRKCLTACSGAGPGLFLAPKVGGLARASRACCAAGSIGGPLRAVRPGRGAVGCRRAPWVDVQGQDAKASFARCRPGSAGSAFHPGGTHCHWGPCSGRGCPAWWWAVAQAPGRSWAARHPAPQEYVRAPWASRRRGARCCTGPPGGPLAHAGSRP